MAACTRDLSGTGQVNWATSRSLSNTTVTVPEVVMNGYSAYLKQGLLFVDVFVLTYVFPLSKRSLYFFPGLFVPPPRQLHFNGHFCVPKHAQEIEVESRCPGFSTPLYVTCSNQYKTLGIWNTLWLQKVKILFSLVLHLFLSKDSWCTQICAFYFFLVLVEEDFSSSSNPIYFPVFSSYKVNQMDLYISEGERSEVPSQRPAGASSWHFRSK